MFADAALGFILADSRKPPTFDCTAPAYSVAVVHNLISIAQHTLSISDDLRLFAL
jgi:hypothetical protein